MKIQILKCSDCNVYTLKEYCHKCNKKTISPRPAKFSPDDKYGKYRRLFKHEMGY